MFRLITLLLFLGIFTTLQTQEKATRSDSRKGEPIRLIWADTCAEDSRDGSKVNICEGHVKIVQGDVTVTSNKVVQYVNENRADFTGNVVVTQEDMTLESPAVSYYGATGLAFSNRGITVRDKRGRLKADSGSYSTQTQIADFNGRVTVSDDSVTIHTDMVQYHRKTRISYAYGNVTIEEDSVFIYCDTAEHHRDTRMSYAYGNACVVDDSVLIASDRLEHNRNGRESLALGNVLVKARFSNVLMFADTIINRTYISYTLAVGNPVLYQIDTTFLNPAKDSTATDSTGPKPENLRFDTLYVSCDTIEVYRDNNERYIFNDSVRMIRNDVSAKCGYAVYHKTGEFIEMDESPVVWYDSTQLHGDSITVNIPKRKLDEIHSYSDSFAASREDSVETDRIDQIAGKEIIIKIRQDTLRNIYANGDTKSLYFLYTDGVPDGVNRDGADALEINFEDGKIATVIKLRGVVGELYPENMVHRNPKQYYLPNFRWDGNTPKMRPLPEARQKNEKKLEKFEPK